MDSRYTLKPHVSAQDPLFKWAVSGPSDDGLRRWRRLFETRSEAEAFLRDKRSRAADAPGEESQAAPILSPSDELAADRAPRFTRPKPAKVKRVRRWGRLRMVLVLAVVLIAAFYADRWFRKKPAGLETGVLLSEKFAANPILTGWSTTPVGTDWTPVAAGASDRAIMVQHGTWSSPLLATEPLQWYRLAFRSKAPGAVTDPGGVGYGYCGVFYFDAAGGQLAGDDITPILQSADWRSNEVCIRAQSLVDAQGGLPAARMRLVFTPIGGQPFLVDDVTIRKVSAREVAGWADDVYAALPARLGYRPKASRWTRIPNALSRMRKGLPLRVVMLGDSVQQDLANSPFDALLQRQISNTQVEVVPSTKAGTGVSFFRDHLPEFVTAFRPDLLIIGGISNGGEMTAFQETVDGVRAHDTVTGRTTEIMLTTRPWSPNVSPGNAESFFLRPEIKELDQDAADDALIPDDERGRLLKFAQANQLEFLDMTGIVSEFIFGPARAAGFGPPAMPTSDPYNFWMRDWVHPNGAGRQIMGRILAQYFLPERTGSLPRNDGAASAD